MEHELSRNYIERATSLTAECGLSGLLGMKLVSLKPGEIVSEMPLTENHMNYHRGAHGGALFALADTTGGFAASSLGRSCTTVNSTIDYMRPVIGYDKVICTAKTVKYGNTLAWVNCDITSEDGKLFCSAKFVYFLLDELSDSTTDI